MTDCKIYTAGNTAALSYATAFIRDHLISLAENPAQATHLLLPVPSFEPDGNIKGGGNLADLLSMLPDNIIILGGQLNRQELTGYKTIDFLEDPAYLAENANITAHCAVRVAMEHLPVILQGCPVLVIGWGRIGKCLAALLRQLGAAVTVAARRESDRAILSALGYHAIPTDNIDTTFYRLIYNTAPTMICQTCQGDGLKIDLASAPGITGPDVIWARGLPNKLAPESSGRLMAQTVMRLIKEMIL